MLGKIAIRNTIQHKIDMADLTLDFTWYRDPKGYRLIPAKLPKRRSRQDLLDVPAIGIEPARIVGNGGKLQSYRPLEIHNLAGLFIRMARTEAGVLEFIEKFGPLTHAGLGSMGEIVPDIVDEAEAMVRYGTRGLGKFKAWIEIDREGMRLKVKPTSLLDALWLMLAQTNTQSRVCLQCRKPFSIGVAVGKRKDAKFCSDECRIKFNSLQRSR
jgi:hypothetical protein